MVAEDTRFAEMNRVRVLREPIEYVKKERSDVNRVNDIPKVTAASR